MGRVSPRRAPRLGAAVARGRLGDPVTIAAVLVAVAAWLVQRFAPLAAGSGVQQWRP